MYSSCSNRIMKQLQWSFFASKRLVFINLLATLHLIEVHKKNYILSQNLYLLMNLTSAAKASWYSPMANPSNASTYCTAVALACLSGVLSEELEGVSSVLDWLWRRILMVNWLTTGGAKMISDMSSWVVPRTAAALWTAAGLAKWGLLSAPLCK